MTVRNPNYAEKVREILERAPFVQKLGIQAVQIEPGRLRTQLDVQPWHLQQNGFVHAGVLTTLADHSAGAAAGTLVDASQGVLSIELKINFLRAAKGSRLSCVSTVLKPGKTLSVAESEVYVPRESGGELLVAKATVTLAVVADTTDPSLAHT